MPACAPYAGKPVRGGRIIAPPGVLPVRHGHIWRRRGRPPTDNAAFMAVMTFPVILGICSIIYPVSMEASKKQAT